MVSKKDEFDINRFQRIRRIKALEDREANFASPEDVILKKMEYYAEGGSEKHLRDISGMIRISAELIDFAYISDWAGRLDLEEIWKEIQRQVANRRP